ncbi:hypothetical protein TNCV_558821 [Trichonephila clavipes]|nr:hypothetical protein TNCV_558821 [Trichonephila clavipes]
MADCEVEGTIVPFLASPERQCPRRERRDERRNIRTRQKNPLGHKRGRRASKAVITLKNNESQLGYDARLNVSLHSLIVILPFIYSCFKNKQIILANPSLRIHPK